MKHLKRMMPFLLVACVLLYGCPYVARSLGKDLVGVILLTPFLCFAIGIIYAYLYKSSMVLPFLVMLLFLPAIYIFYSSTAYMYPIFFGISVLIGEIVGRLLRGRPDT